MSPITAKIAQIFAAAALSIGGFTTLTPHAQAYPVPPLAPACDSYKFIGNQEFDRDDGMVVTTGTLGSGPFVDANSLEPGVQPQSFGHAAGTLTGTAIDFTVDWIQGPRGGSTSHFTGQVDAAATSGRFLEAPAAGTVTDSIGNGASGWHTRFNDRIMCDKPAAAPAPPAPVVCGQNGPPCYTVSLDASQAPLRVTVTIHDNSGVDANNCSYDAVPFDVFVHRTFSIKANGDSAIIYEPALLHDNRNVIVDCHNGHSTSTSVSY